MVSSKRDPLNTLTNLLAEPAAALSLIQTYPPLWENFLESWCLASLSLTLLAVLAGPGSHISWRTSPCCMSHSVNLALDMTSSCLTLVSSSPRLAERWAALLLALGWTERAG